MPHNIIVILGPTASGKTKIAARLARDMGSEILSADSRQVYRGLDIGSGKDLTEYVVDGVPISYHLIDIVDPDHEFSVFEYQQHFFRCFEDLSSRKVTPILVGGTGLYIESVLKGYRMPLVPENRRLRQELENEDMALLVKRLLALNPAVHNSTDLVDRNRLVRAIEIAEHAKTQGRDDHSSMPRIIPLVIGIRWERPVLRLRITNRLRERLSSGMVEEVRRLHDTGVPWEKLNFFGLEYRYVSLYLQGIISYGDMFQKLNIKIHQFAKKQETWFRRMERQGTNIHWIEGDDYKKLLALIKIKQTAGNK
jgi:tRNA dimethylallyltransferase